MPLAGGYTNVEFYQSTIDDLPLHDASVDCVISNCVLNLAPDKPAVFREIFRVLKPGGRLAVSDIALKGELPEAVSSSLAAYVGCIAGAIRIEDYQQGLLDAGFKYVEIVDGGADLNAYAKVEPIGLLFTSHGYGLGVSDCAELMLRTNCTPSVHEDLESYCRNMT